MSTSPFANTSFLILLAAFVTLLSLESFFLLRAWRSFLKNTGTRFQLSLLELAVAPLCLFLTFQVCSGVFTDDPQSSKPIDIRMVVLIAALMAWCQLIGAAFFLLRARRKFGDSPWPSVRGLLLGSAFGFMQFIPFITSAGRLS